MGLRWMGTPTSFENLCTTNFSSVAMKVIALPRRPIRPDVTHWKNMRRKLIELVIGVGREDERREGD